MIIIVRRRSLVIFCAVSSSGWMEMHHCTGKQSWCLIIWIDAMVLCSNNGFPHQNNCELLSALLRFDFFSFFSFKLNGEFINHRKCCESLSFADCWLHFMLMSKYLHTYFVFVLLILFRGQPSTLLATECVWNFHNVTLQSIGTTANRFCSRAQERICMKKKICIFRIIYNSSQYCWFG